MGGKSITYCEDAEVRAMYQKAGPYPTEWLAAYILQNPNKDARLSNKPFIKTGNRFGQIDPETGHPFPGGFYIEKTELSIYEIFTLDGTTENCLLRLTTGRASWIVPIVNDCCVG